MTGQSYYDDDIYYDPSKERKVEQPAPVAVTTEADDFEEPTYQVYTTELRDVDEYNRRGGIYKTTPDSLATDSVASPPDVFTYTEKIERFDNPNIIRSSDDERLKELYYADNVNIYVGVPSTYVSFDLFSPWYSSWYYSPWSISFHYDPWYSWSYGWSWGWGYYRPWYSPYWGPSYGHWCWHHPHYWGGAPVRRYADGGRRPLGGTYSSSDMRGGRRPALPTTTRGYDSRGTTGRRPSSSSYIRPSVPSSVQPTTPRRSTTYTNGYRGGLRTDGRTNSRTETYRTSPSNSRTTTTTRTERTTPSYNSRTTTTTRGGGSFRGGSSGGSRGSFGGGSRGGRR